MERQRNEMEITYKNKRSKRLKIFVKEFIKENKDKCKIYIRGKGT